MFSLFNCVAKESPKPLGRWSNVGKHCEEILVNKIKSKETRVNIRESKIDPYMLIMNRTNYDNILVSYLFDF